jgi:hypothetical protein
MSGPAAGFAIMAVGSIVFLVGWVLVAVGTYCWARAAGVSFWRFAFTYGQERTDVRLGHPFEAGLRFWRDVFSRTRFEDAEAESARRVVRRGALGCTAGLATALVGWVVAAVALAG